MDNGQLQRDLRKEQTARFCTHLNRPTITVNKQDMLVHVYVSRFPIQKPTPILSRSTGEVQLAAFKEQVVALKKKIGKVRDLTPIPCRESKFRQQRHQLLAAHKHPRFSISQPFLKESMPAVQEIMVYSLVTKVQRSEAHSLLSKLPLLANLAQWLARITQSIHLTTSSSPPLPKTTMDFSQQRTLALPMTRQPDRDSFAQRSLAFARLLKEHRCGTSANLRNHPRSPTHACASHYRSSLLALHNLDNCFFFGLKITPFLFPYLASTSSGTRNLTPSRLPKSYRIISIN